MMVDAGIRIFEANGGEAECDGFDLVKSGEVLDLPYC
jgi:hypothetical protein